MLKHMPVCQLGTGTEDNMFFKNLENYILEDFSLSGLWQWTEGDLRHMLKPWL